jgi:hypothetical protein
VEFEYLAYWRSLATLQYWRSFEELERLARDPDDPHTPAWRDFNKTVGTGGTVGIFHETFVVERANYEAVYNDMPVFGLAKATESVPAIGGRGRRPGHTVDPRPARPNKRQRGLVPAHGPPGLVISRDRANFRERQLSAIRDLA